ncbi:M48 family metallopeptidase [Massilia genomosp. 1]|uniref:M48 family metalloprotease n=1 Tax=Massilia genomosp. 1 TaxID=2609280 RepID=A0ABX0MTY1_9BURK|nr:M48 family metallopeptidase [Massilia genomosp. 1]NHZ66212.1 M48 family metalloprotease [Massilia genomosp. 1]
MQTKLCLTVIAVAALAGCATSTKPGAVGVTRSQMMLVSASEVDAMALTSFSNQNQKAKSEGRLVTKGTEYNRVARIAKALQVQVPVFRDDAKDWKWELALIDAPVLNASCAPGGKITFYTGLIRQLKLTDDEIAMVMGHEIAHALREHGRERMSQAKATGGLTALAGVLAPSKGLQVAVASEATHYLFTLPNSREHESEADTMGLELAARAGYNPRAAMSVWEKMAAASGGAGNAEFLSTHPSDSTRIASLTAMQPRVTPLYEAATKPEGAAKPEAPAKPESASKPAATSKTGKKKSSR